MSLREARANPSSAQDNAEFIPPRPFRHVVLDHIYVSVAVPTTVTLNNSISHTPVWKQYVGINGGSAAAYGASSVLGEGLDLHTTGNGDVFIWVSYHYSDD